jgi:hypothetical protein
MITIGINHSNKRFYGAMYYLCDYENDVANLPIDKSPGSEAVVIETGNVYMLNSQHEWILQQSNSNNNTSNDGTIVSGGNIIYDGGNIASSNENNATTDVIFDSGTT